MGAGASLDVLVVETQADEQEAAARRAHALVHGAGGGAAIVAGLHRYAGHHEVAFDQIDLLDVRVAMARVFGA